MTFRDWCLYSLFAHAWKYSPRQLAGNSHGDAAVGLSVLSVASLGVATTPS
jgi:hypothetical protein